MTPYISWLGKNAVLFDPREKGTIERQREWEYLVTERLGILCGADTPTPEQIALARSEADAWFKESRGELL